MIDYERLAEAIVDELEERSLVAKGKDIVPVAKYAHEKDVARSTVYRQAKRRGVPIRDHTGSIKDDGGISCISRTEMEMRKDLGTRKVRRMDGQYD